MKITNLFKSATNAIIAVVLSAGSIFNFCNIAISAESMQNETIEAKLTMSETPITDDSADFTIEYFGDVKTISITDNDIGLSGFSANKSVSINKNDNTATVHLTHIVDLDGENKVFIAGGTAIDNQFNMANALTSEAFEIDNGNEIGADVVLPTEIKGDSFDFTLEFYGDVKKVAFKLADMNFIGFTADAEIIENAENDCVKIRLTNVVDTQGDNHIKIAGGCAISSTEKMCNAITSNSFAIKANPATGSSSVAAVAVIAVSAFAITIVLNRRKKV